MDKPLNFSGMFYARSFFHTAADINPRGMYKRNCPCSIFRVNAAGKKYRQRTCLNNACGQIPIAGFTGAAFQAIHHRIKNNYIDSSPFKRCKTICLLNDREILLSLPGYPDGEPEAACCLPFDQRNVIWCQITDELQATWAHL